MFQIRACSTRMGHYRLRVCRLFTAHCVACCCTGGGGGHWHQTGPWKPLVCALGRALPFLILAPQNTVGSVPFLPLEPPASLLVPATSAVFPLHTTGKAPPWMLMSSLAAESLYTQGICSPTPRFSWKPTTLMVITPPHLISSKKPWTALSEQVQQWFL